MPTGKANGSEDIIVTEVLKELLVNMDQVITKWFQPAFCRERDFLAS